MTSAQIQALLRPPDHDASVKHAASLLNSTFTTLGQARTGSALANSIHAAKTLSDDYDSQLASSKSNIDLLVRNVRCSAQDYLVSAKELSLLRHSLADELATLSDELVSSSLPGASEPSLLEEVEALHRDLQELQSVKGYVQVIHRALQLSEQAVREMKQAPASFAITEASVTDYVLLRELVDSVGQTCKKPQSGTGQEIKLLSFLIELLNKTWSGIKEILFSSLLSAAEDLHWPMPIDYATAKPESRKAFECTFVNLLKLQEIGERLHSSPESDGRAKLSNDGLYPLQALIRPVALRFKYHFEGTRQTNRLDKPEWYFAHILNVSHEHRPFLEAVVQRLVHISSIYKSTNVWREFTRLLFPILSRKLRRSMPILLPHPPLLAHTVYQALAFDDALREAGFSLIGTLEKSKEDLSVWEGISDIILGSKDWFNAWLEGERRFAEDQYIDIISASDAWQFSEDAEEDVVNDQEVRPTNSARRVKALIEQITDRYRSLPRFLHKARFLIAVQVPILELYHTRISESLDAFESLSSFLARAVPGALAGQTGHGRDMKNSTSGVEGAQRLVKAYVSAKWMSAVMQSWGEDMFFLELWHEICEKASLRSHVEDVDALPDPNVVNDEETIFEELVAQYNKLAERAESMLVRQICGEVEADLKAHLFNSMTEAEDAAISQTLLRPIAHLSAHISFLRKMLPVATVVGLYRQVAAHVGTHVLQRQLLYRGRGRMSSREGRAVLDEANLWVEASRMALGGTVRRAEMPWERLLEAGRLLSLDEESFQQAVRAVRLGDERDYEKLAEVVGIIEMSSEEVMEVLSVREDYPK